ncbi:MAG: hypothetical protein ACKVOE_02400 [Rickettsiales bacterium]
MTMLLRRTTALALLSTPAFAEGLPQMDATWFGNQLFWLAVSFVLLYAVVVRVIMPGVGGVLDTRAKAIADAIAEAEEAKRAAAQTRGDVEVAGNSARAQASELLAKAQAEASREASDASHKLAHDLARKTEQAEVRLAEALKKASAQVDLAVADLSAAITARLLAKG